jgi:hypothetical protein
MDVLIAAYGSPQAARHDYRALTALYHHGALRQTRAIVLVTSDDDSNIVADETGGGLLGKFVGHSVKQGFRGQLPPSSGSVVAIFDAAARPEVDRVVTGSQAKAYATAAGSDDEALESAFAAAEQELSGLVDGR